MLHTGASFGGVKVASAKERYDEVTSTVRPLNLAKSLCQIVCERPIFGGFLARTTEAAGKGPNWLMLSPFSGGAMVPLVVGMLRVVSLVVIAGIVGIEWTIAWIILLGIASIAISFDAAETAPVTKHRAAPP